MNLVGDLLNKYKCYVVIDFSIIVVLVIFYFVYVKPYRKTDYKTIIYI